MGIRLFRVETHRIAFRILDPGERTTARKRNRTDELLSPERFRPRDGVREIFDAHIKNRVVMRFVPQRIDVTTRAGTVALDPAV